MPNFGGVSFGSDSKQSVPSGEWEVIFLSGIAFAQVNNPLSKFTI